MESGSRNGVFLGLMALVVGWVGYFVGYSSDLKYGMGKLFAQAFIIVLFGGRYSGAGLFSTAVSRIAGIIGGMIVYLLVSLVLFPSTGTELAYHKLAEAMGHLKQMHDAIWKSAFLAMLQASSAESRNREGSNHSQASAAASKNSARKEAGSESLARTVTQGLEAMAACVRKFDDNMEFAKSERYLGSLRRPFFLRAYLPMFKWINKDHRGLPKDELEAVRLSIRRVARTLWTLSLAVGDAPHPAFVHNIRKLYGSALFQELAASQGAALREVAESFRPDEPIEQFCPSESIERMLQALEKFLALTEEHRQDIMESHWRPGTQLGGTDTRDHVPGSPAPNASNGQAENSGDVCIEPGPHQHRQSAPHAAAQLASSFPDDEEDWQAQNSRQDGSTASHHHQCHPSPDKPPNEQQQEQLQGEAKDEQCKQTASHTQPSRHQVQKQEDGRQQQRPRLSAPALFDASDQGFLWKIRFNTFQFAICRLAVDVVRLHRDVNLLLASFPGTKISKRWSGLPEGAEKRFLHELLETDLSS